MPPGDTHAIIVECDDRKCWPRSFRVAKKHWGLPESVEQPKFVGKIRVRTFPDQLSVSVKENPASVPAWQLHRHLGAHPISDSRTRFCVWSPTHETVSVRLIDGDRCEPMQRVSGYHVAEIDNVRVGDQYLFQFGKGPPRPDPASRFQPAGVHGPSEVISSEFAWTDADWTGAGREDLIIYELHIGAFTDEGTFAAAAQRLGELVDLGITAIELMPVSDAAGRWNWGYDGVCLFAPNRNYGTPDDLRRLVDAAHAKGLAVILDVVYNHLGPEGNYLGESGPYLSSQAHHGLGRGTEFRRSRYMVANCESSLSPTRFIGTTNITSMDCESTRFTA